MNARARAALAPCLLLVSAVAFAQQGDPHAGRSPAPDVPAGSAVVVGRLVHPTRPEAAANADVLLYALSADGNAGLRQGRTDASGRFRFEGVSNAPDVVYLVGARPGEIPFGTRFSFKAGEREHSVELALSDPTADTSRATAADLEMRIERGCTHLRVSHRHRIENRGDRVVFVAAPERAGAKPIFEVELPAEAEGFEAVAGGDGIALDGRRVRFWGPLYPGEQTIEFGYGLPLATASFETGFPSGAPPISVLAPNGVVAVSSDALRGASDRTVKDQRYAVLHGAATAAGGSLALAITSTAPAASPLRTPRAELWLELDDAALEVDERIEVVADGDGAPITSAAAPLLCLPVPAGAGELRFSSETFAAGLRRDPSGDLAIHGPLPRGSSQLAISYRLPATSEGASLAQTFDRALPLLSVLVADNGVFADTTRLHRRSSARVDDRSYLHLEAFSIEPGESIEVGLRRTPPAAPGSRAAPAGFALLAGLAAFGFLLGPLRARDGARASAEPEAASLEREAIVRSLEALDEDLETGKLSAEDHAAMRASLRARAAALLLAPQVARSPQGREATAQRGEAERSVGPREGGQASEADQGRAPGPPQPAPKFCSACGAGVRPTDAFCSQCGNKL
ncbi:MAG: zinc ribbon domain-containing protein [Deltaproteobacteria bacterium]|nr:MAG: zinc ribbon domain-containing protein [Deltaproteobacteria bacterium]